MSSDIGQDILKSVRADFAKTLDDQNSKLGKLFKKIQDGSATMSDISTFSVLIGQTVSSAVEKRITPDVLPDGTLYFNIAQTVLQGVLKDSYELINLAAQSVQERLDSEYGLHIKPVKPDFPEERIRDIAGAASTASMNKNEEKEERRLTSPVENVVQSFYSDYVRENADLRSKAGLNAYIIRRTNGRCCPWCSDLAGRYRYEDAPSDVYARHDNCTCTVDFVTDKYRQDVWNKRKYSLSPEERRKALEAAPKPTRYTREQAKNLQDSVMNRVANSGESGIIESIKFNSLADPMREIIGSAEETHKEEIEAIAKHFDELGVQLIRPENEKLAYEPGLFAGTPGKVIISKGASYSAWLHEQKHVDDDYLDGWLGMRVLANPQKCAKREKDAYQVEIDFAKSLGRDDIVKRLEVLRDEEIRKYE